jgi:SAM-dependent methyltransferase
MGSRFAETAGVDVVPSHVDDAKRRALEAGLATDFRAVEGTLPWADGYFDTVTLIEVLEHVEDEYDSLTEIRRVLSKDGRLYVSVPNRYFPFETHGMLIGDHFVQHNVPFITWIPPLHRRISEARSYTYSSLKRLLEEVGFMVSAPEYIMPPFEKSPLAQKWFAPVAERVETSFLRGFGVSVLVVARPL